MMIQPKQFLWKKKKTQKKTQTNKKTHIDFHKLLNPMCDPKVRAGMANSQAFSVSHSTTGQSCFLTSWIGVKTQSSLV